MWRNFATPSKNTGIKGQHLVHCEDNNLCQSHCEVSCPKTSSSSRIATMLSSSDTLLLSLSLRTANKATSGPSSSSSLALSAPGSPPHSEAAPYSAVAVGQVWLVVLDSLGQVWRWVHRVWGGGGGAGVRGAWLCNRFPWFGFGFGLGLRRAGNLHHSLDIHIPLPGNR